MDINDLYKLLLTHHPNKIIQTLVGNKWDYYLDKLTYHYFEVKDIPNHYTFWNRTNTSISASIMNYNKDKKVKSKIINILGNNLVFNEQILDIFATNYEGKDYKYSMVDEEKDDFISINIDELIIKMRLNKLNKII